MSNTVKLTDAEITTQLEWLVDHAQRALEAHKSGLTVARMKYLDRVEDRVTTLLNATTDTE